MDLYETRNRRFYYSVSFDFHSRAAPPGSDHRFNGAYSKQNKGF